MLWGNFFNGTDGVIRKGVFMNKKLGLLGMGSAVLIAAAALGIHGLPVSGTGQNQEALLNGVQAEWTDDKGKEYPGEEFFETETDMTEFEGKLEDITA